MIKWPFIYCCRDLKSEMIFEKIFRKIFVFKDKRLDPGDFCFWQQLKSQTVFSDFETKLLSFIIWFENRLIRKKMRYAYHRVNFCFKGWLRLGHWVFWGCWGRVWNGGHCKLWDAHKWSTKPARRVWPRLRSLFKINQLWT